jgi:serine protease Do
MRPFATIVTVALVLAMLALPVAAQEDIDVPADAEPRVPEDVTTEEDRPATADAVGNPYERAVHLAEPSIVYLDLVTEAWVDDGSGWLQEGDPFVLTGHCSGSVISPDGYILTASHCVDGNDTFKRASIINAALDWYVDNEYHLDESGNALYDSYEELFDIAYDNWKVEGYNPDTPPDVTIEAALATSISGIAGGRVMGARIVESSTFEDGDVALIKVEQSDLPALPLASTNPNVGAEIVSIGYPGAVDRVADADLNAAYKDGRISQLRTHSGGRVPMFELSSAMGKGMSGGPTINMEGEIVGVNSQGIEDTGGGDAFNFVAPVSLVREITARNGIGLELDEISQAWRDGVTAFHANDYATAIEHFDTVLAATPSHAKATELRTIAVREQGSAVPPVEEQPADTAARETGEDVGDKIPVAASTAVGSSGPSLWILGGGGLLLLLMGMGSMFAFLRRPARGSPAAEPINDEDPAALDRR